MKLTLLFLLLGIVAMTAAPQTENSPEATTTSFFTYLLSSKHDITKDSAAQTRWLTKDVRQVLAAAVAGANKAGKAHPGEQIDSPDNGTFLAAWDPPTTFKVTEVKSTPPTAHVDLLYKWGPKTNYPGETRKMTALLTLEDGAWHISDIQSHKSKFNPNSTLLGDLRGLAKQH
ncbi:MAG: hypothetical protein ABJF10_16800 [Chthoniobacter sp.]|uniref:hypothetical protein n=1 Tax=Chthoniobacter sp. TaxID=2510640 RepID=UPI0032A5ECE0